MTLRLENLKSSVSVVSVNGLICILTPIIIGVRIQMKVSKSFEEVDKIPNVRLLAHCGV